MSDHAAPIGAAPALAGRIFWVFLVMGATSLGGGVVGYLRTGLVVRQRWLDDVTFVELLSISQTLPGLNATNMSILVGDRLRGGWGALLATLGMCLPGATLMTAAAYRLRRRRRRSLVEGLPARHRRRRRRPDRGGDGAARRQGAEERRRLRLRAGNGRGAVALLRGARCPMP